MSTRLTADRLLVLRNVDSPDSCAIADDYAARRGARVLDVRCADAGASTAAETIAYADAVPSIVGPLRGALAVWPQVEAVVLTKGIPLRLSGAPDLGLEGPGPSLDSWLAALDYGSVPGARPVRLVDSGFAGNAWANRFWRSEVPFDRAVHGGLLVTRLDGWTRADAIALGARAQHGGGDAPVLLDVCPDHGCQDPARQPLDILGAPGPDGRLTVAELDFAAWNADLVQAARMLHGHGLPAMLDERPEFAGSLVPLGGYASWGSNHTRYRAETYRQLRFAPGALCETAVSTSARTFLPTQGGQSLIADLVAQGATGAKGYSDEPLLQAVASPSILFDRWARGWPLAWCYLAASRFVGWQDIVLGDPLATRQ